ncbi:hypothetical protein HQ563_14060 [bacterium]|nr:hypothetical protein [bacterium]
MIILGAFLSMASASGIRDNIGPVAMVVLVIITAFYAYSTWLMARATKRMANENERLRKERAQATLSYLLQEAKINLDIFCTHYGDAIDKGLGRQHALMRFSLSGRDELPKVMAWLGEVVEELLERYSDMQRVNARIDEYYADPREDWVGSKRELVRTELKRLAEEDKFKLSLEKIKGNLEKISRRILSER